MQIVYRKTKLIWSLNIGKDANFHSWKEKSKLKVAAVSKELEAFVHDLNALAKKQFNPN